MWTLTILPARRLILHAHRHLRVVRTMERTHVSIVLATKVILVFSLVASLGKYAFRIQNPYLFIDCSIEIGIAVVYWKVEKSDIRFHNSSHLSKQVSNSFTVTDWTGMVFIRYRRCLLPKTKGTTNSDV